MISLTILLRIQFIIVAIQLFIGVWAWLFPVKKISNPSKKLVIGCCYHSKRAESSQEAWDYAQRKYSRWCLLLVIPSALISFAASKILLYAIPTANETLLMALALLPPLAFLLVCRRMTERDLKYQNYQTLEETES